MSLENLAKSIQSGSHDKEIEEIQKVVNLKNNENPFELGSWGFDIWEKGYTSANVKIKKIEQDLHFWKNEARRRPTVERYRQLVNKCRRLNRQINKLEIKLERHL